MMGAYKGDASAWQSTKIGAGPVPIETDEGWLLIYHGVLTTCNGYVYRMGCALLDIDEPWKVKYRSKDISWLRSCPMSAWATFRTWYSPVLPWLTLIPEESPSTMLR